MENDNYQTNNNSGEAIKAYLLAENHAETVSASTKSFYKDALKLTTAAALAAIISIAAAYTSVSVCGDDNWWSKYLCFVMVGISFVAALSSALAGGAGLAALGSYRSKLKDYNSSRQSMSEAYQNMVKNCGEDSVEKRYF